MTSHFFFEFLLLPLFLQLVSIDPRVTSSESTAEYYCLTSYADRARLPKLTFSLYSFMYASSTSKGLLYSS